MELRFRKYNNTYYGYIGHYAIQVCSISKISKERDLFTQDVEEVWRLSLCDWFVTETTGSLEYCKQYIKDILEGKRKPTNLDEDE